MSELRTARALVFDRCFNVLVAQRKPKSNRRAWQADFPGGQCEPGEMFWEASLRELDEELIGLDRARIPEGSLIPEVHVSREVEGSLDISRWYGFIAVDSLDGIHVNPECEDLIGSSVVPAVEALHMFNNFLPHQIAIRKAIDHALVA
jgi:8-oxo-dGTP pyrophosphatase MutT (NUDIX family)